MEEKEIYYADFATVPQTIPKYGIITVMRDCNAKLGKTKMFSV